MQKNDLLKSDATIYRILAIHDENALIIDCKKRNMPKWRKMADIENYQSCTEEELAEQTDVELFDIGILDTSTRKIMHTRYTIIAGILPFICDEKLRSLIISRTAEEHGICKQTVRNYLCLYLIYQNISVLAPKRNKDDKPLSKDEKNMRWALNKFFYTKNQNSLPTAYR